MTTELHEAEPRYPPMELLTVEPPAWEYCSGRLPDYSEQECMAKLNRLGAEGWELVCVVEGRYLFKRQRRDEAEG